MSKAEVKKYIKSLERNSLEELVMDLYSARKEAKEYLENVIKPNDKGKWKNIERLSRKNSVPVVVMPNCASPSVVRQFRNINRLIQHQNFWQI